MYARQILIVFIVFSIFNPLLAPANPDLLTNSDFELPLGSSFPDVLVPPHSLNAWGAEAAMPVPAENGIQPFDGNNMLRMENDFLSTTQIVQRVDISNYASVIDSGNACTSFSARFNANLTGAVATVNVFYLPQIPSGFTGNLFNFASSQNAASATLDNDTQTWEIIEVKNALIPVGTRSLLVQISYRNDTIGNDFGYVDAANLCVSSLLSNTDFESPLGSTFVNVLGTPFDLNAWGAEAASIVNAENGIVPNSGISMLRMDDDGLVATQMVQRVDVSNYAANIDNFEACVSFAAFFNVPAPAAGASASVIVFFIPEIPNNFNGNIFSLSLGQVNGTLTVDGDENTWEMNLIDNADVPLCTRSLLVQISYNNDSLAGNPGYVDTSVLCLSVTPNNVLKGDVNQDGLVNLLDVQGFVDALSLGIYIPEADINCDGTVNLLDVQGFIDILSGCQ